MPLTKVQTDAIKKLEAGFLACKRAGLVFCGIDDNLICTSGGDAFSDESNASSPCEAMIQRVNGGVPTKTVKTYGVYLDSGGA
jgi:hypothetical protein